MSGMGSDLYAQEVMSRSHGGLITALTKAREVLAKQPKKNKDLLAEIDQTLNNARIS